MPEEMNVGTKTIGYHLPRTVAGYERPFCMWHDAALEALPSSVALMSTETVGCNDRYIRSMGLSLQQQCLELPTPLRDAVLSETASQRRSGHLPRCLAQSGNPKHSRLESRSRFAPFVIPMLQCLTSLDSVKTLPAPSSPAPSTSPVLLPELATRKH